MGARLGEHTHGRPTALGRAGLLTFTAAEDKGLVDAAKARADYILVVGVPQEPLGLDPLLQVPQVDLVRGDAHDRKLAVAGHIDR